jgi:hydroxymethylglutaryl-CoA synthase
VDFRKPVLRNILRGKLNCHFQDLPVFNGKYSTTCYVDETLHALNDMTRKMGRDAAEYYRELSATFMHRPYHRMPETSFAMSYLFALSQDGPAGLAELEKNCQRAEVPLNAVLAEMRSKPDILDFVKDGNIDADAYPLTIQIAKEFRGSPEFTALVAAKMSLGSEAMKDIGNVYCAALPAWMAAGLEDAYQRNVDLAGGKVLAIGYGSGDAAEAIPMTVARGWKKAAAKIGFQSALEPHQDLTQVQYENLHDTGSARGLLDPEDGFVIQSIGSSANANFSDEGVEYYRFVR